MLARLERPLRLVGADKTAEARSRRTVIAIAPGNEPENPRVRHADQKARHSDPAGSRCKRHTQARGTSRRVNLLHAASQAPPNRRLVHFARYARFATPQQPPGPTTSDADRHETPLTAPQRAQVRLAWVRGHEPRIDGYGLTCRYDAKDLWTFGCSQVLWDPDGSSSQRTRRISAPCAVVARQASASPSGPRTGPVVHSVHARCRRAPV